MEHFNRIQSNGYDHLGLRSFILRTADVITGGVDHLRFMHTHGSQGPPCNVVYDRVNQGLNVTFPQPFVCSYQNGMKDPPSIHPLLEVAKHKSRRIAVCLLRPNQLNWVLSCVT